MQRRQWSDLPDEARAAVEAYTGPVLKAVPTGGGLNSGLASVLHDADGAVFVKGLPADHAQAWTQGREAAIAPHVADVAPRMLWHVRAGDWDLIGYEHIDGRHADYTPGSPDMSRVAEALALLGKTPCPDVPVKTVHRWQDYVDRPEDLNRLDGVALLHTDLNPTNILVPGDGRALLVDWAWPTRAAAWIDPACWVVWLVAAGHTPAEAERQAAAIPSWSQADAVALDMFARVQARLWAEIADDTPGRWAEGVAEAAAQWEKHRT